MYSGVEWRPAASPPRGTRTIAAACPQVSARAQSEEVERLDLAATAVDEIMGTYDTCRCSSHYEGLIDFQPIRRGVWQESEIEHK